MMFFKGKIQQDRCRQCNYKLSSKKKKKLKKIAYLRSKQTIKKIETNIITGFKLKKKVRLIFSRAKYIMKGKCYVFSDYQEIKRVPFLSLECTLQKDRYG